ncbi:TetR-like C-terminal domain-containing protein [Terribacillus sp. FSL K6-0262]|uniref:TetR-like C-terminal domain-containing protein n=1 Tax=Terribacillus TaxID=459532 RepID=UPI0030EE93EC
MTESQKLFTYEEFYSIILSKEVSLKCYYMLFDEIQSMLLEDKHAVQPEEIKGFLYSYTANAIIGLIIEWYRRDFRGSANQMNVLLVNILRLKI